ncbi:MAG: hypothetical protein EOO61_11410 [Hymenobacter sp.]|nr:MAG: hypothetical protein EOO61_11410 [Hymenobacter sp.]
MDEILSLIGKLKQILDVGSHYSQKHFYWVLTSAVSVRVNASDIAMQRSGIHSEKIRLRNAEGEPRLNADALTAERR